jgi:hypothetical protein
MNGKKTSGSTRATGPAASMAETRERVKAAKKVVKNAKAALKSARRELKEAKQARNAAEARHEAQTVKRAPRTRRPAVKIKADVAPAIPKLKRLARRRVRIAATPAAEGLTPLPAEASGPETEHAPGGAVQVIESVHRHAS